MEKPRRLGRGLDALIPGAATSTATATPAAPSNDYQRLPIAGIRPNPYQPRREFDEAELSELQASLKSSGLLQPITVRRTAVGYELISGERRLRAATRLGWTDIPAIIHDVDDRTLLTLALVENLQAAFDIMSVIDRGSSGSYLVVLRRYRFDNLPSGGLLNIKERVVNSLRDNMSADLKRQKAQAERAPR